MELPYEEYTRACHFLGSYFQGKIPKMIHLEEIPDRVSYFDDTNWKPKEDRID